MKVILRIFSFLIISVFSLAQTTSAVFTAALDLSSANQLIWNNPVEMGFSNELEEIDGGPFYESEWLEGRMILKNGQTLGRKWKFKYNTFQDELHIRFPSGEVKIPLKTQIQSFVLVKNGKQHFFVRSDKSHQIDVYSDKPAFYEVLQNDGFMLLKNTSKHYAQHDIDPFYCSSCDVVSTDFFFTAEKYFLVEEKDYRRGKKRQFKKIKLKRKSILRAIPQHKSLVLQFLKESGQELKTEQSLLTLLEYLNDHIGGTVKM